MSSTPTSAQFDTDPIQTIPQSPEAPQPSIPTSGPRYRVVRPHARGGLGEVFVAEDTELGRRVALKEIQARYADNETSRTRFVLEAEITGGLEHPGIVPVYGLGTYADGRPFYAMRFIHGESLREAVVRFHEADTRTQPARRQYHSLAFRQLLTRFMSVCQAVAYAHSRGVLHRDLKPSNIMLGRFGETLVVDWGLAKAIGRAEEAEDTEATLRPRSASDSSATVMGQALGTPAYMSPEQADGRIDRLGPASDIYSLGATLYELLTGRPPFTGLVVEILTQIRRGDVPSPRDVRPDVPRPLAAICLKAMKVDPKDRYPTADALAADVERWLADEPVSAYREPVRVRLGRWVKRHRPLVAGMAAVLVTGVISLGVLLLQSEHSRTEIADQLRRAEEARTYTRRALDDMTSEFTEGSLKTQRELSPAQAEFLKRVLVHYKNFAAEPGHDREGRERLARASGRLGIIQHRLGQLREADDALRQAEELFAGLAAEFPGRSDYRLELAANHNNRGNVLADLREPRAAETAYRAALAVKKQLLAERPDDPEYRSEVAAAHRSLGVVLHQLGRRAEAASSFRAALDLQQLIVSQFPSVVQFPAAAIYHWELARSRSDLGNLLFELGEPEQAEATLRPAVARFEELATEFRDKPDYRDELATAYLNWGRTLLILGRPEEAKSAFQAAQTRQERLVSEYPGVPEYRRLLGQIQINLTSANVAAVRKKLTDGAWSLFGPRPPKRHVDLAAAEKLAASNDATGDDLYNAAVAFASAATHPDAATAEKHAAHAAAVLRQAFARGFHDVPRMLNDPDLAPLRNRTDYINLMWDVADGPPTAK